MFDSHYFLCREEIKFTSGAKFPDSLISVTSSIIYPTAQIQTPSSILISSFSSREATASLPARTII